MGERISVAFPKSVFACCSLDSFIYRPPVLKRNRHLVGGIKSNRNQSTCIDGLSIAPSSSTRFFLFLFFSFGLSEAEGKLTSVSL